MKKVLLTLFAMGALTLGLSGGAIGTSTSTADAAPPDFTLGLVNVVADVTVGDIVVHNVIDDSFNNIHVLENFLNKSLNDNEVNVLTIEDSFTETNILNDFIIDVDIEGNEIVTVDNVTVNIDNIIAVVEVLDLDGGLLGFIILV